MVGLVLAGAVVAAGCGPELTTPGDSNLTGIWLSSDTAVGVTDFELKLSQGSDGVISGTWSAVAVPGNSTCPAVLGCAPANSVVGSNTVFQVHVDLLGAGPFIGQVEAEGRLRGHLSGAAMTFERVAIVQGASRLPRDSR